MSWLAQICCLGGDVEAAKKACTHLEADGDVGRYANIWTNTKRFPHAVLAATCLPLAPKMQVI